MISVTLMLTLSAAAGSPAQLVEAPYGLECPPPVQLFAPVAPGGTPYHTFKAPAAAPVDVVLRWNEAALTAIRTERTPPPLAARNLAIVHAAIHDAVNAIQRTHTFYLVRAEAPPDAGLETAAASAAHRTLISLYPRQVENFDAILDRSLANGPVAPGGLRLGLHVAEQLLAAREKDGARTSTAYAPRHGVGMWRPTPPDFRPALLPQWPSVTCFCMKSGHQFRPAAPPPVGSAEYWANFAEVKALGGADRHQRSAEQTQIAHFWADDAGTATPPGHWNQVAQAVARARGLTTAENARLFALLNLALADAAIASWDCKYQFHYWRPIEGIRAAPPDADPARRGDPAWTPLLATPPFPSYTSGHSTFSGAAAAVLANYFGTDAVRFTVGSDALPGVTRSFTRFSEAAAEAGRSRIYGGIHWEFDNSAGLASGRALGDYVSRSYLRPYRP